MGGCRARVLLIEDDRDDYLLTRELIAEIPGAGYGLEWVNGYDAALEAIGQDRHDAVLIDYFLGERDGLMLVREAVSRGSTAPLILLTGKGNREVDLAAMEAGAWDYLDKDEISAPLLERALRYALQRRCAEDAMRRARDELEDRVRERTAELEQTNGALMAEIAERKRSEEALRASEERFRLLVEGVQDYAIFMLDPEGRVLSWNAGAERINGYRVEEILGHHFSRFYPAEDVQRGKPEDDLNMAVAEGRYEEEGWRLRKDGSRFLANVLITVLREESGALRGFAKVTRDITERNQIEQEILSLNDQLEHRLERLAALRQIDLAITASHDLRLTLGVVIDQVLAQLRVDAADILLLDPTTQDLENVAGKGMSATILSQARPLPDRSLTRRIIQDRRPLHIPDLGLAPEGFSRAPQVVADGFIFYLGVPLIAKGQVNGVLEVFHRDPLEPGPEWLEYLEALAGQAAIAVENAMLFESLRRSNLDLTLAYDATIEGWSRALDLRDKETEGHTQRVTAMSLRLARAMGIMGVDLVNVRRGALLHDIGKMGIPDAILLKADKLTDEEWQIMRRHPEYAYEWLSPITFLRPALEIPYCHHERWDGTGYPQGLKGEQIPLAARIFAAVDIWDALRSDRPYRKGWSEERVIEHIRSLAGTHLDPAVVDVFLRCHLEDLIGKEERAPVLAEAAGGSPAAEQPWAGGTVGGPGFPRKTRRIGGRGRRPEFPVLISRHGGQARAGCQATPRGPVGPDDPGRRNSCPHGPHPEADAGGIGT